MSSIKIVKTLIENNLVEERKNAETNLSNYLITDEGKEKVRQLIDKYGTEIFAPMKQNPDDYDL